MPSNQMFLLKIQVELFHLCLTELDDLRDRVKIVDGGEAGVHDHGVLQLGLVCHDDGRVFVLCWAVIGQNLWTRVLIGQESVKIKTVL